MSLLLARFKPTRSFYFQALTASGLATFSDVLCQKVAEKHRRYDPWRTARFAATALLLVVPVQYNWFRLLNNRLFPGTSLSVGIKRMLADQIIVAPLLTPLFIFTLKLLESGNVQRAKEGTRKVIKPVLVNNYKVWPLVQTLNMTLVPLPLRVIFVQFVSIFWNIYVSHAANKPVYIARSGNNPL